MIRPVRRSVLVVILLGLGLLGAGAVWAVATSGDVPVTLNEDETNHAITLTGTTSTADATVTWTVTGGPSHGTLGATTGSLTCTSGDCTGSVDYTPDANYNGSDAFTYNVSDSDGPSAADGTVSITVDPVNDPPTFDNAGDPAAVNEDAGGQTVPDWATNISPGPADESSQTVHFSITGNTNAALFSAGPAVAADGTLSYTPAANQNGTADITVVAIDDGGGSDTSAPATFTITVNAVNDPPTFDNAGDPGAVNEDAGAQSVPSWATNISPGPADESSQTVHFSVTGDTNPSLFSAGPAVAANGTLSYTPAANANGTADITVEAVDDGGGADTSAPATFTITVNAVNDPPTFTAGGPVTADEDSGAQTESGWATGMSPGPADESGQALDFQISSNTNPGLFSAGPAVNATTGNLTFTPAANANGSATVGVKLHDNGGGTSLSAAQTVVITINAVNDAPSFVAGPNVVVNENSSAYSATGWATGLSTGPANESGQALTFSFPSDDNSALFSAGPAVSASGTLTFTPATGQSGTAHLTLQVKDDGGTAHGGVDTSATQDVTIRVNAPPNAVNDTTFHVAENSPGTSLDVLANDTSLPDPPETLTITAVTQPGHGKVVINAGGGSVTYTPVPLYYGQGSDYFTYTISDGYATDQATVIVSIDKDTTPPTVTSIAQGLRTAVTMTSTTLPGRVSWAGNDGAGVGIDHYTLQRSTNGGSWSTLSLPSKTSTSLNVSFTFATKYRFRVHAVDRNGNVGAWTYTSTFTEGRYQETSSYIKYSGYWAPTSNVNDSGGAAKYTTVAGRYALFAKTMRDVAFVSPMSSTRGSVKVYVDGAYVKTISLKRSTTAYRQVMWTMHFATSGSHSVKLVVVGNGRVDLDCFVVLY